MHVARTWLKRGQLHIIIIITIIIIAAAAAAPPPPPPPPPPIKYFIIPCRKFELPYLGKATAAARAALLFPTRWYSILVCPDNGVAVGVWDR